jgi:hypothetical protein
LYRQKPDSDTTDWSKIEKTVDPELLNSMLKIGQQKEQSESDTIFW